MNIHCCCCSRQHAVKNNITDILLILHICIKIKSAYKTILQQTNYMHTGEGYFAFITDTFLNRFKMIREFGLIEGTWELLPSSTAKFVYIFSNKLHGNIHSPLFNVVFSKINVLNKTSTFSIAPWVIVLQAVIYSNHCQVLLRVSYITV